MSEFSESYHLKSQCAADAVELLRRAGLKGYVYAPTNGWVTFVAQDNAFEPDQRIVAANSQLLLHYVFAADHEWSFAVFEAAECVCAYRCDWNDELKFNDSEYSSSVLGGLIIQSGTTTLAEVEAALHPSSLDEAFELEAAYKLAGAVGLEHYEWLDYRGMANAFQESPEDHLDVTAVE